MTAQDLISRALRLAGIIGESEVPTAAMNADALDTLNDLIDQWNTDGLMLFQTTNDTFNLIPGKDTYTIGPGGDFNDVRPVQVNSAFVEYQGVSFPLYQQNQEEFNLITLKSQQQVLPRFWLYLNTAPLGTLQIWPVPSLAMPLTLTMQRVLPPLTLASTIDYPPGYAKALRYGLAVELLPEYGMQPSPLLIEMARSSKATIKRANYVNTVASYDPTLVGPQGGIAGFLSGY